MSKLDDDAVCYCGELVKNHTESSGHEATPMTPPPEAVDCPECQEELRTSKRIELHSCDPKNQPRHQEWLDALTNEADLVPDKTDDILAQLGGTEEVEPDG